MLFTPTQREVRRFFCDAWNKSRTSQPLEALEAIAVGWITEHPHWYAEFADAANSLTRQYPEDPKHHPFLHISMHLAVSEQCSIDQPRGIRQAVELLAHRHNNLHTAHHVVMRHLAEMINEAHSSKSPPDGQTYLEAIQRQATSDTSFKS
jgi:hypothetical protein